MTGLLLSMGCTRLAPAVVPPATATPLPPTPTVLVQLVTQTVVTPSPSPTPTATSQPTVTPTLTPTPTVEAMPIPSVDGPLYTYHELGVGESLSYVAWLYGTTVEELVALNEFADPSVMLQAGQLLRIPLQLDETAPGDRLLPDSEVVYSPAYADFDIAAFIEEQGGYLATYTQTLDGEPVSGAAVVERVAARFSVGPRLLLALIEHYSGWVTDLSPSAWERRRPVGPRNPQGGNLYLALSHTANEINAGYYGYKRDGFWVFRLADRSKSVTAEGVNAGTVGVQNLLAMHSDAEEWPEALGPDGFISTYKTMFGDPAQYAIEPLIPRHLEQVPLALPWPQGQGFYYTSGPHPAYLDGSAWAAIDFGPPDILGSCYYSEVPNTAAADGVVVIAEQGEVQLDLDGDGLIQTGWGLLYLHVALDIADPVQVGDTVQEGDIIGYASCEGGLSTSSHLHFARRYNGEWLDAGGPVPMNLSGWEVQPSRVAYDGYLVNGPSTREACECWDSDLNLIVR